VKRNKAKNLKRNEAKRSEKIGFSFSLVHAKTKRNGSYFASFRFEAKKIFKQNRRTLRWSLTAASTEAAAPQGSSEMLS
jgi:hypothetical protein